MTKGPGPGIAGRPSAARPSTGRAGHEHGLLGGVERIEREYSPTEDRPLGSFVGLLGAYAVAFGAAGFALSRRRQLPPIRVEDVLLYGVATSTIARTIAKDPITSPIRAPFVEFTGETTGPSELKEEVRGSGTRKALGELLTCPFCVAPWVATAFVAGHGLWPRAARFVAGGAAVATISDFLQYAISGVQRLSGES